MWVCGKLVALFAEKDAIEAGFYENRPQTWLLHAEKIRPQKPSYLCFGVCDGIAVECSLCVHPKHC